jgi:hypothetical protein
MKLTLLTGRNRRRAAVVGAVWDVPPVVTVDDVRSIVQPLPRAYEVVVHDRVKFRVGRLVFAALSRDETLLGFAYPKLERDALIASDPGRFLPPLPSDERYNWVRARMAALDRIELAELVVDAWTMVVPKFVAAGYRLQ